MQHRRLSCFPLVAVLAASAGCFGDVSTGPRRCEAVHGLPDAEPFPAELESRIAATEIPPDALPAKHHVCNRLALEPATFARRHSLDAVDWRPWSPAALAEAERLRRPLFVLTGFSAAAGCRSLPRRAFSHRRVARVINSRFVPVLVDRDERPDVDAYLMQATEVLTGGGGWPAVVFLEPDGRPFAAYSWGAASVGRKKLEAVVEETTRRIALGGSSSEQAESTMEKMQKRVSIDSSGPLPDANRTAASLVGYLAASYDAVSGSFGAPPLFPRAPLLEFLLSTTTDKPADPLPRQMATVVLAKIRQSALADSAGGGFFRYAEQPGWQQPACEKMLADNAALASAYLQAAESTGGQEFRDGARSILDFLLKDLRLSGGAFAASVVSERAAGSCDGCVPGRDEAVLADANALAISALARGARVLAEPRFADAATKAAEFVDSRLREGGRVRHCLYPDGRSCADGYLADHALVANAFLDLDATSRDAARWLDAARTIADAIPARFEHAAGGGFFQTANEAEPLPLRFKPILDTAVPSGNGAAAALYARLAAGTGEPRYGELCRRTLEAFSNVLTLRPLAAPSLVTALGRFEKSSRGQASVPPQLEPAPAVQP